MLEIKQMSAGYGKKTVIEEISAAFTEGQITSLIGPNGSGKSTLVKAVMGFCTVSAGTVRLDGTDRREISGKEFAKKVSYLPQSHAAGAITAERMVLHGRFPCLSYPRHYGREDYERCEQAMERAGILSLKGKRMETLSGGERQKVYLAMALARDAEVFLFDEPTTYLDVCHQAKLKKLMLELREQNKTVISVLHDMNSALQLSDRVLVLQQGRLAMDGTPEQVYDSGVLDRVFGVTVRRLFTPDKTAYYFV